MTSVQNTTQAVTFWQAFRESRQVKRHTLIFATTMIFMVGLAISIATSGGKNIIFPNFSSKLFSALIGTMAGLSAIQSFDLMFFFSNPSVHRRSRRISHHVPTEPGEIPSPPSTIPLESL